MSVGHLDDRVDELPATPEGDLPFDPDTPNTSPAPGGLTRMFYVGLNELPAAPEIDLPFDPDTLEPLTAPTAAGGPPASDGPVPLAPAESAAPSVPHSPVDTTDMSVGHLDACLDEFEDIQLDTSEIDHDINLLRLPATTEVEIACSYDAPQKEVEESTPDISSTSVADETPKPMLSIAQEEPLESGTLLDNRVDDEPGLVLEETGDVPLRSKEHNADTERAE